MLERRCFLLKVFEVAIPSVCLENALLGSRERLSAVSPSGELGSLNIASINRFLIMPAISAALPISNQTMAWK